MMVFGTFCVGEFKSERTVLIRVEHFAWQQKRYQSGNHYMRTSDLGNEAIEEFLWSRVEGRTPWQTIHCVNLMDGSVSLRHDLLVEVY